MRGGMELEHSAEKISLIVICGPTASGKTALSVELAKALDAEIISADSMQVYRGMDIGTAKPTMEERQGVPHHLIDIIDPSQPFDVAQYCELARQAIADVRGRGKLPILAGGTGLYISTLVDHVELGETENDPAYRKEMESYAKEHGNHALHEMLRDIDPESYTSIHENNVHRVVRALEVYRQTGIPLSEHKRRSRLRPSPYDLCMIGLSWKDRQQLYARIDQRVDAMMAAGLQKEVEEIAQKGYNRNWSSMQAIGYKELLSALRGEMSMAQAVDTVKRESRRYAKRQLTWLRRDGRIRWIELDSSTTMEDVLRQARAIVGDTLGL